MTPRLARGARCATVPAAALAIALFATGCSAQDNARDKRDNASSAAPSRTSAESTPSAPSRVSLSVTPDELRAADPCKLIDEKVLAKFGKAEYDRGISYGQCDIQLDGPDDGSVSVFVDLQSGPSDVSAGDPAPTPVLRDGVTVYENESYGEFTGGKNCTRDVVVREGAAAVAIGVYGDESDAGACPIADTAAADVIRLLKSGDLPSARHAPDSLANHDACELIKKSEAARVPGIDPDDRHADFTGQSCTWGAENIDEPHLYVLFEHLDEALEGRPLTVGGRTAAVKYSPADEDSWALGPSLPSCSVDIEYGEAGPTVKGQTEVVSVGVSGYSSRQELCALAQDLAPKAVARL
ncbi:DUF3558 family protein [Streptomyces blattellae]|uniref:DUF3558 family protein n=1 Tax=Streptomyces blattellae TaxID=2569855 RepID=UPI0012B82074|nr:DUF3558 family protein [Streptomyces blattellae]